MRRMEGVVIAMQVSYGSIKRPKERERGSSRVGFVQGREEVRGDVQARRRSRWSVEGKEETRDQRMRGERRSEREGAI